VTRGAEAERLRSAHDPSGQPWLRWGPYLSERQWGTVREDYSADGNAWDSFSHDQARSRAYRWGEDGLAGLSDDEQRLCFAVALWNGRDPILKERLFGLTNGQGNHGEDVKEYYYFLDNTPTHSYQKWLYKYPQAAYPYDDLVAENGRRKADPHAPEFELVDTGVFDDSRYFDVQVEYAKAAPGDVLIRIRVDNRGPEAAALHLLPTLWFRNTWSWLGTEAQRAAARPALSGTPAPGPGGVATVRATHAATTPEPDAAPMALHCLAPDALLFADNDSNDRRLWGSESGPAFPKDGINDHVVTGADTVNPALTGTKAAAHYRLQVPAGGSAEIRLRLSDDLAPADPFGPTFEQTFTTRIAEADAFYRELAPATLTDDERAVQRQAYAGMLWSKQWYHYIVRDWLDGDPAGPAPPAGRERNAAWRHYYAADVLTMPDTWEYPWFASWDLCFQSVVFARLDVEFAKNQLRLLVREWSMSPDGAVPAYEWSFSDVNPPLHAWAALRILAVEQEVHGRSDDAFLAEIFRYCLMYFTWWTNRKDAGDNNLFQGGFLGLDNISVLDRSHIEALETQLGRGVELYQSDGTSWMGMFSLQMMEMSLRLERLGNPEYARLASTFFQHFVFIAEAMNSLERRSGGQVQLWDDDDGFYYDALVVRGDPDQFLRIGLRSLVGLIALFPVAVVDLDELGDGAADHELKSKLAWFVRTHPELVDRATSAKAGGNVHLLSFVKPDRLRRILQRALDEAEFLGPHGVRGISRAYLDQPFAVDVDGARLSVQYEPAESSVGLFGGNSNWRGPVWFPINYLLVESLRRYHEFLGDDFTVEHPTGSGVQRTLDEVATDLSRRLVGTFLRAPDGTRPVFGGSEAFQRDPHWRDHLLFYEYFHGDNGAGIGASHQTGWTGLVAELLHD
jgi:hypothetical protein